MVAYNIAWLVADFEASSC